MKFQPVSNLPSVSERPEQMQIWAVMAGGNTVALTWFANERRRWAQVDNYGMAMAKSFCDDAHIIGWLPWPPLEGARA